jgi:uncharacterized protein
LRAILREASCAALLSLAAWPVGAIAAGEPVQLTWEQLIPPGGQQGPALEEQVLLGIVEHGQTTPLPESGADPGLVTVFNGKAVRIPGFVVPLDFEAEAVKEFLLVPYLGACIHVPPPPPNQIIHVRSDETIGIDGLYAPVWVTGTLVSEPLSTELAEVGYRITADAVEPYEE